MIIIRNLDYIKSTLKWGAIEIKVNTDFLFCKTIFCSFDYVKPTAENIFKISNGIVSGSVNILVNGNILDLNDSNQLLKRMVNNAFEVFFEYDLPKKNVIPYSFSSINCLAKQEIPSGGLSVNKFSVPGNIIYEKSELLNFSYNGEGSLPGIFQININGGPWVSISEELETNTNGGILPAKNKINFDPGDLVRARYSSDLTSVFLTLFLEQI